MKPSWTKILSYVTIPVLIAVGTIIYKAGHNDGAEKVTDEMIIKEVRELKQEVSIINCSVMSLSIKTDSLCYKMDVFDTNENEHFRLINKEIDILARQDKSGEALQAIMEWRSWYEDKYTLQQFEKKNSQP